MDGEPTGSKPPSRREDALAIVKRLREQGHVAYFAGGCVRDALLGLDPKDYDVATDAPPPRVRELFSNTQAVGAAFGVILVRHGKSQIEVATFRTDDKYEDGRRPTAVHFTTAQEDAQRRDFTINGLFFDPIENRVIDYVGGQEDLKNKILRAIGDPEHRFAEDHLRVLRAIRFAARFGLEIEPATNSAIAHHARHLIRISPERVAEELRLIFSGPDAEWAWYAMRDLYPDISNMIFRFAGPAPAERHNQDLFRGPESGHYWRFGLALAALSLEWSLMQSAAPLETHLETANVQKFSRALRQSLRISNNEVEQMEGALLGLGVLLSEHPPRLVTLKRFLARPTAGLTRELLKQLNCRIGQSRVRDLEHAIEVIGGTDYAPPPLISGDDLTAAGLMPGPMFKRILDAVYDAQLEDRVATKEQAMAMALELAKQ